MPSGMFIHRHHRHVTSSVNQPPSNGPATEDNAKTPPMMPMYFPRSRAGTTSAMIAWDRTINPPPPSPWMPRPAISHAMSGANPPTTDPTMNRLMAPMKMPLRPTKSPIFP